MTSGRESFDVLIINGQVVDGTGNPWFWADVGIRGGKIVALGKLAAAKAARVIDAKGLVVAPGFIEPHAHSEIALLLEPQAHSHIRQGLTTTCNGNCGFSPGPFRDEADRKEAIKSSGEIPFTGVETDWLSFGGYLDRLERQGVAMNTCTLVGHGRIRAAVMGFEKRLPTKEELAQMKVLLRQALDEGAAGLSSGLVYPPGIYSDIDEMAELCKVVAEYGRVYTTHKRGQGDSFVEATAEAIEVAEWAGASLLISHHAPNMSTFGKVPETLQMMEEARARGVDVLCDKHGMEWGGGSLQQVFPPWFSMIPTEDEKVAKLKEPVVRERLKREIHGGIEWPRVSPALFGRANAWEGCRVVTGIDASTHGKSIAELASERRQDPLDVVFDLLVENHMSVGCQNHSYWEEDIRNVLKSPLSMISSDSSVATPSGPQGQSLGHPKTFGTFPQIYRKYVRGETRPEFGLGDTGAKILSLEEAVKKMTSVPAQALKLWDRGIIRPGMWADIAIFDAATISDKTTYANPRQYPVGIPYVLVNGVVAIDGGEHTGALAGKVIRY